MKRIIEDYPISVNVRNEDYYFGDDVFCCNCGKQGVWLKRNDWHSGEHVVICTQCKYLFSLCDVSPIPFRDDLINQEIFIRLTDREAYRTTAIDAIKSLGVLET